MLAWKFSPLLIPLAFASIGERAIRSDVRIYAYGVGIDGLPIYADSQSMAMMADNTTAAAQGLTDITWTIDTTGSLPWNTTTSNSSALGQFYIMPADEFRGAGFVMNSTAPSGAATVGFVIYGSNVEYATETTYESKFYARIVSDGVWSLMWNSNSESQNGSIPVILKTVAPSDD